MASSESIETKTANLLRVIDPALTRGAADPAKALLAHLSASPRGRFLFEYERPTALREFLRTHYAGWRHFEPTAAERLTEMTLADARGPRATINMIALGQAWLATGDPRWGTEFQRFFLETATGEMFNWGAFNGTQGEIELSPYFLLLDCPGFTRDGRLAFLDHLFAITANAWDDYTSQWNQLELGPEGHNWYIHGMLALPFVGLLFPEHVRAAEFLYTGWSVVEEHLRGHYRADGGARETTPGYQLSSLEPLWELYLIASRNGYPLSNTVAETLLRATHFLLRLMTPDGSPSAFGDSHYHAGSLTMLAALATAATGDRECKWYAEQIRGCRPHAPEEVAGAIPESAFWLSGLAGAATYAETRARDPRQVSVLLGDTGYAALRDGDRYLCIAAADRGPIVTSHGHNDIFALEVHAVGARFLGQAGIAPYGESPGRDYDESTAAHSTLTLAGQEQTPLAGEWRWTAVTMPAVRRWISEPTHDFFHGVHEGFYHYPDHRVLHARKVFFIKSAPSYWLVIDWIESDPENAYEVYFHGCQPGRIDGDAIWLGSADGPRLTILPPVGDGLHPTPVQDAGRDAYFREIARDPTDYPAFVYRTRAASTCLPWLVIPQAPAQVSLSRLPVTLNGQLQNTQQATALEIHLGNYTDYLCVTHREFDGLLAFGPCQGKGFLAYRRIQADGSPVIAFEHSIADGVCGR